MGPVEQVFAADQLEDARPVAVVFGQAEHDPLVVLGLEDVVERVVHAHTALGVLVAVLGGHHARRQGVDTGMLQGAGDVVAFAGLFTADVGGQDAGGQEHGSLEIAVAVGRDHREAVGVDRGAEDAAATHVAGHVEAGRVFFGALLAVAQAMAHDQLGVLGVQALPVEAHLAQRLGAVVGDEDVGGGEQLVHGFQAGFALQVQADHALVHVGHVVGEVLIVGHRHAVDGSLVHAGRVAFGGFDLDDIGAPFAEHAARGRGGKKRREVDDLHTFERQRHMKFLQNLPDGKRAGTQSTSPFSKSFN